MTSSTYTASRWSEVQSTAVQPLSKGISQAATAGTTTNIDLSISDDVFFRGIEVLLNNSNFGDTITVEVLDNNSTIVGVPVYNWNVQSNQNVILKYESLVPLKLPGTYTLRVIYSSTGLLNVTVAINYILLKVLF